jgi:integrase
MSVSRPNRNRSPYYHYDFVVRGRRFHGSTKCTSRREAEAFERAERERARAEMKAASAAQGSLELDDICERYRLEVGQHHVGAQDTEADLARLIEYFGAHTKLTEIDDSKVAEFVAWRRGHRVQRKKDAKDSRPLSNAATNRSGVYRLRALFRRATVVWKFKLDNEPTWKEHLLPEGEERVRELVDDEGDRLRSATRSDYDAIIQFALATGFRLNECLLKWSEVDWGNRQIRKLGKGKRKVTTPITDAVRAILAPLRNDHPEMVFCYQAKRTMKAKGKTPATAKGRKYPISYAGLKSAWKRIRKRAKLTDFRFHDLRHDCASKVLRATGNLKLTQRVLNHADVRTTMRYAHVRDEEISAALQGVSESRNKSRNGDRNAA